jgi:hypothetical protein
MEGGEEEGVQDRDPDYHEQDLLQGGDHDHDHDLLDVGEGEEEGPEEHFSGEDVDRLLLGTWFDVIFSKIMKCFSYSQIIHPFLTLFSFYQFYGVAWACILADMLIII